MRTVCLTMKRMKTYSMKAGEIDKRWHVVNAEGETLGRLAARVGGLPLGKHQRHTGCMGGLKTTPLGTMMQRQPGRVIEAAVRGMLPRNRLSRHVYRHLKVYAGPDHPHEAQVNASRKREAAAAASSSEK